MSFLSINVFTMDRIQVQFADVEESSWAMKSDVTSLNNTLDYIASFATTGEKITPYKAVFFFNNQSVRYIMESSIIKVDWDELDEKIIGAFTAQVLANAKPEEEMHKLGLM